MAILAAKNLWVLPFCAGLVWFVTLFSLLVYWLANGRETYPGQSNPHVPFISDIGAFQMHAFFVVGGVITAITFAATVISVHYARYHRRLYAIRDVRWRKSTSVAASVFGVGAAISLILLTIFDTAQYHDKHQFLLLLTLGTLAISAFLTTTVWFDQAWGPSEFEGLRRWCLASNGLVIVGFVVGVAFIALLAVHNMAAAGVLEWIITFLGSAYLFCFVGYLWVPSRILLEDDEVRPLLAAAPRED